MTSLLTNYAAMSAVRTLTATQKALATTQSQISTGLKVATAQDDAAYWSISTSMKSQIVNLQAVNDGLNVTDGILSTTSAALNQILTLMQGISKDVTAARSSGADQASIAKDIAAKQQGIISAGTSASYNGVNWLVSQSTDIYSATDDTTWDGTYADVYKSNGTTPIAYTRHGTRTTQTVLTPGSSSSGSTTTSFDDSGTYTPATGQYVQHIVPGPTTTTGNPVDNQDVSLMLTTGSVTTFDIEPLTLFGASGAIAGTATDHETFTDGSRDFPSFIGLTDTSGLSLADGGILAQNIPLSGNADTTVLTFDATNMSQADLAAVGSGVADALAGLQNAMSIVGSTQNEVDGSKSLNSAIIDALQSGVGSLVDADVNADSTRLMALQTQQQLGIQALGIANDNNQMIMKLFAG